MPGDDTLTRMAPSAVQRASCRAKTLASAPPPCLNVTLYNWTDQGIKGYPDTVQRAEAATAAAEKMGGKVHGLYWRMGTYDIVTVGEFPGG